MAGFVVSLSPILTLTLTSFIALLRKTIVDLLIVDDAIFFFFDFIHG